MSTDKPLISLIACLSENRVIGSQGKIPWHLPEDLKYFKRMTLGKPVIMGRKTYEAMGGALSGRDNIIITKQPNYVATNCTITPTLESAISACCQVDEIMIIGGGQIYQQALPLAQRLYLTIIHQHVTGDTYFPEWETTNWHTVHCEKHLSDGFEYSFITLDRPKEAASCA